MYAEEPDATERMIQKEQKKSNSDGDYETDEESDEEMIQDSSQETLEINPEQTSKRKLTNQTTFIRNLDIKLKK